MMEDSLKALWNYAEGSTNDINHRFRKGTPTLTDFEIAEKISRLETPMELPTLYRATLWRHFTEDYGVTRENIHFMVGKTIIDNGYLSTSVDRRVPKSMYPIDSDTIFIRILSNEKHKAINVNAILGSNSPTPSQKEIILGRGTKFSILHVENKDGITYIDVELIS